VIVYNCKRKTLQIKLSDTLNIGDGIGIEGEEDTGDTVTGIYKNGKKINSADSGSIVEIPFKYRVKSGSRVYKTFDKHLNESLEKTFTSSVPARKIPVSIIVKAFSGSNLELKISDGTNNVSVVSDYVVENALSKPTSKKQIEKQIAKMGNTVFDPSKITIHSDNNIFIPISQLNSIKNKAITRLEKKRIDKWKRPQKKGDESYRMYLNSDSITSRSSTPQIAVNVVSTKQLESAVSGGANLIYYEYLKYQSSEIINDDFEKLVETAHNSGCRIYLNTPRIITDNEMDDIKNSLSRAKINNFDGVLVSNPGFLRVAKSMGLPVVVNTPLNIFNKISFNFMLKCGAEKVVLSPELTIDQIKSVSSKGQAECIVHGPLEVMVSEYCFVGGIFGSKKSCGFPCRNSKYEIVDEKGYSFPLEMDENCRTHIYNSRDLCMLDNIDDILKSDVASIRINAGTYKPYDVEKLTKMYKKAVNDSTTSDTECTDILKGHTTGHYYRGVL
jgi:putative protease